MADERDELTKEHEQYRELAQEMSQPAADVPGVAGGGEYWPEYDMRQPREPEPQARQPEPGQHQRRPDPEPQPQPTSLRDERGYLALPDVDEDPILHFSSRMQNAETYLHNAHAERQHQDLWGNIEKSEAAMRADLESGEYDDAMQLLVQARQAELYQQVPDTPQNMAIARQQGYASPAHFRHAVLQHDAQAVAQQAIRNGITPAQAYYHAALQRGHQPRTVALKSHMRGVMKEIDSVDDATFSKWWDGYAERAKYVDEVMKKRGE